VAREPATLLGSDLHQQGLMLNVIARGDIVLTTDGDGILILATDNNWVEHNEFG
jgi:hypothetical protein